MNPQGITPSVAVIYGRPTLTLDEVAHALQMHRTTVERQIADGRFPIPHLPRTGRRFLFSAHAVDKFLRRTA